MSSRIKKLNLSEREIYQLLFVLHSFEQTISDLSFASSQKAAAITTHSVLKCLFDTNDQYFSQIFNFLKTSKCPFFPIFGLACSFFLKVHSQIPWFLKKIKIQAKKQKQRANCLNAALVLRLKKSSFYFPHRILPEFKPFSVSKRFSFGFILKIT